MPTTATTLASAIRQHKPRAAREGYPPWLRKKVGRYVDKRRKAGAKAADLSAALGVSVTTLGRWQRSHRTQPQRGGFAPVVTTPPPPPPTPLACTNATVAPPPPQPATSTAPAATPAAVHITSPQGFSLHGLSIEQAIAVFVGLR